MCSKERYGRQSILIVGIASLLLIGGLVEAAASPGRLVTEEQAVLDWMSKTFPDLSKELMFVSKHPAKQLGQFRLYYVSTTEFLPPPRWVTAVRVVHRKVEIFFLKPDQPNGWNRIVENAGWKLTNRKALARFPITYLNITAPGEKPRWRFGDSTLNQMSPESQKRLKKGWAFKKNEKDTILIFYSENLVQRLSMWQLTVNEEGKIFSIRRRTLE